MQHISGFLLRCLAPVFVCVCLGGCGLLRSEFDNSGGIFDRLADRLISRADNKFSRALRAYMIQGSLLRLASLSPSSASEKSVLSARHINANDRLSEVLRCAAQRNICIHFDSVMVDYENSLYEFAIAVLQFDDRKSLISSIASLLPGPGTAFSTIDALLTVAEESAKLGRPLGALYRDNIELQMRILESSEFLDKGDPTRSDTNFNIRRKQVIASYYGNPSNVALWKSELRKLYAEGYEPAPTRKHFLMVYNLIYHFCGQIGLSDTSIAQCREPPNALGFKPEEVSSGKNLEIKDFTDPQFNQYSQTHKRIKI